MSSLLHSGQNIPAKLNQTKRKKIIILSSTGGGGHSSAAYAIKKYLNETEKYEIKIINLLDEIFGPIDPFKLCSFGYRSCEDFYNFCLQKNWSRAANNLFYINTKFQPYLEPVFDRFIDRFVCNEQPDILISVIPLVNGCIKRIIEKYGIPFIIVPTDLDASLFMFAMQGPYSSLIKLCLSYNNEDVQKTMLKAAINNQNICIGGFPIRPDFFEPKNKAQIKSDFNIVENKPIILLLMGAAGSDKICTYVTKLKQFPIPAHIVICLGRLESLRKYLELIKFPPHISVTIVSHTHRISDLMAVADVAIIKPGSVSVNEALYLNLPIIIDNIGTPLIWEKFNIDFTAKNKFGSILNNFNDLQNVVAPYIAEDEFKHQIRENIASFSKEQFGPHIKNLVHSMLEHNQPTYPSKHEYQTEQKEH